MTEELSDVAEFVGFITMNSIVVFGKSGLEQVGPKTVDLGKSFSDQTVELGVCSFLGTTFDDHGWKFVLQPGRQVDLHQLVTTFFEINAGHDREVDCSSKVHQISVTLILYIHLHFLGVGLFLLALL
jgi:hypothetical protein